MLESVLLHLSDHESGDQAIEIGVRLARQSQSRVRGLTLLDTRQLESVLQECEAAVYAFSELQYLNTAAHSQESIRAQFCQACLAASVDFDLRSMRDNPFDVLAREAPFHDLLVAGSPAPGGASPFDTVVGCQGGEMVDAWTQRGQPILVVRGRPLERVLLVYDGSPASARAVRSFFQQKLLPESECRLLTVGQTEAEARGLLKEISSCYQANRTPLEAGCIRGSTHRVLLKYAQKWRADLVVLGASRRTGVLRWMQGKTAHQILNHTACALYAVGA